MDKNEKIKGSFIAITAMLPFIVLLKWNVINEVLSISGIRRIIEDIPYFGFAVLGYMGWKLNQTRIVLIAALLIGSFFLKNHLLTGEIVFEKISVLQLIQLCSIFIPTSIILILSIREGALTSPRGMLKALAIAIPFGIFSLIVFEYNSFFYEMVNFRLIDSDYVSMQSMPQWYLLALLFSLPCVLLVDKDIIKGFILRLPLVTPAFIFGLYIVGESNWTLESKQLALGLTYSCLTIVLVSSIFRLYWQRVYIDELTQIPNRRALDEHLEFISGSYCVAMIDVDHFKKFNDTYGHEKGDDVLRFVGTLLKNDPHGKAFRYGGEEFCLVFKGADMKRAFAYADLFRDNLYSEPFNLRRSAGSKNFKEQIQTFLSQKKWHQLRQTRVIEDQSQPISGIQKQDECRITVSIGVCGTSNECKNPYEILRRADQALYKAKEKGRNRVVRHDEVSVAHLEKVV